MRSIPLLRLLVLSGCAALPPAQAALSLDQAVRLAGDQSRLVAASMAQASAARERAVAAARRPDPTLKLGLDNLPLAGPDRLALTRDFMTMRTVGLGQELTRGAKREARAQRHEREAEAAEAEREARLAEVHREAARAWLDRWYAERSLELLDRERDEARLGVEAAEAAYRARRGTQAEVFAARGAAARLDDRRSQAERQAATATTGLARWIGPEAAAQPLESPPAMQTVPLLADEIEARLPHHPAVAAMLKQEQVAEAEAELARREEQSDWTVEVAYSQRGPSYSNMLSLAVSVPLQWDAPRRQARELAARLAEVDARRAEREDATRAHAAELRAALQSWQSQRERLARYDAALLPLAAQRTQAALAAYRGGQGSLGEVLEARRGEIEGRLERLALEQEAARLWAGLTYLVPHGEQRP